MIVIPTHLSKLLCFSIYFILLLLLLFWRGRTIATGSIARTPYLNLLRVGKYILSAS